MIGQSAGQALAKCKFVVFLVCFSRVVVSEEFKCASPQTSGILTCMTDCNLPFRVVVPECGNWNTPTAFPRIPRDTISVKVYRDGGGCCIGTKDYSVCQANGCSAEPTPVLDKATGLQLEYDTKVTGEVFPVSYGHKRRRRRALLQGLQGNCGERL